MKKIYLLGLCLILVVSGVITYLAIGPKRSEGSNNLAERVDNLETRLSELESRLSEQLILSNGVLRINSSAQTFDRSIITFEIKHIGTEDLVTVSEIRVNNVLNSSSPGWEGLHILVPGYLVEITLYGQNYFTEGFTLEIAHNITVTTTNDNTFYLCGLMFVYV